MSRIQQKDIKERTKSLIMKLWAWKLCEDTGSSCAISGKGGSNCSDIVIAEEQRWPALLALLGALHATTTALKGHSMNNMNQSMFTVMHLGTVHVSYQVTVVIRKPIRHWGAEAICVHFVTK